jgi:hypothetical protein
VSVYDEKPWLSLYDPGQPAEIALEFTDALSMFRASVSRNPDGDIIRYFGGRITARELDELSDAFAVALAGLGVRAGDRVALYLQNVPQFVIGMLATWKAGGIAVPVNPMNRARELEAVLSDSGARVLVCLESLYRDVVAATTHRAAVVTTSELDYRAGDDQRVFAGLDRLDHPGAHDMAALIEHHRGQTPADVTFGPDDTAFLTYTSGTTGRRCARPPWSGCPTPTAARPSRPTSACGPARRPRPRSSSPSAASRWRPTNTLARSSSSTSCPRPCPASFCAASSAIAADPKIISIMIPNGPGFPPRSASSQTGGG